MKIYTSKDLPEDLFKLLVERLKKKTNFFDYQTEESFLQLIQEDKFIVFQFKDYMAIGERRSYPTGLTTLIVTVISTNNDSRQLFNTPARKYIDFVEEVVKKAGIDRIVVEGRKGWGRLLPDYSTSSITLFKDL